MTEKRSDALEPSAPVSSSAWRAYFRHNLANLLPVPWERGPEITAAELRAVASSMQGFQLGESSEGRHLLHCAQEHAAETGEPAYFEAVQLFIREEQRHARELGRFLTIAGVPLLRRTWPDTVFRWLRHRSGLELSIAVLVTAEIIALVYYAALRDATRSLLLRRLCEQILKDEVQHVRFQSERLGILRRKRPSWLVAVSAFLQRVLMAGTVFVVWWKHHRALAAGGFNFRRFSHAVRFELESALSIMDPRHYEFAETPRPAIEDHAITLVEYPAAALRWR